MFAQIVVGNLIVLFIFLCAPNGSLQQSTVSPSASSPAGTLNQCGEQHTVTYINGQKFVYKFECPEEHQCVNQMCQSNATGAIANSVVTRCNEQNTECIRNFDLNALCGFTMTMQDAWTYYFNCPSGSSCQMQTLTCRGWVKRPILITRCNVSDLSVEWGRCQGNACPSNLQCINTVVASPKQKPSPPPSTPVNAAQIAANGLLQCGDQQNVTFINSAKFTYKFDCPANFKCVNSTCQSSTGNVTRSAVSRCNLQQSGQCEQNINLNALCGFTITKSDGFTYYMNCPDGTSCSTDNLTCSGSQAIITRCNKADLWVDKGKCQGTCPADLKCSDATLK